MQTWCSGTGFGGGLGNGRETVGLSLTGLSLRITVLVCSQLWIAKPFFQTQKASSESCDFSICFLYFAAYSNTLHWLSLPAQGYKGDCSSTERCSQVQLGWTAMVIPFSLAIWQLDTCAGVEVCISTDASDHTEAPAGGQEKGHEMAVAEGNDCKDDHSSNTSQKINFLLFIYTLADFSQSPRLMKHFFHKSQQCWDMNKQSRQHCKHQNAKLEHEAPETSRIEVSVIHRLLMSKHHNIQQV